MRIGFFGDSLTEGRPGVSYVNMLRGRFPVDDLVNFGRAGDSVIGTYERVAALDGRGPFDLAFVWTGVNDVLAHISWASPITRRLLGEPWVTSRQEFVEQYRLLLKTLEERGTHRRGCAAVHRRGLVESVEPRAGRPCARDGVPVRTLRPSRVPQPEALHARCLVR